MMFATKVVFAEIEALGDAALFEEKLNGLSSDRRAYVEARSLEKSRQQSLGVSLTLDRALETCKVRESEMHWSLGKNGKPFFTNRPDIFFSLSHSADAVVSAVSSAEIGVDIERVRGVDLKLAKRFFTPSESEYVFGCADEKAKTEAFFRLWVLKESFIKAVGRGLSLPLDSFSLDIRQGIHLDSLNYDDKAFTFTEYTRGEYRIAVCSAAENAPDGLDYIMI